MEVVYRIEGRDVEAHPTEDVRYMLKSEKFRTTHFRLSAGTLRSSKILVPMSFMVVTTKTTREMGMTKIDHKLTYGNICLRKRLDCRYARL